ncbi:helix-turn-helix transcriptional regulator [Virgibacillus sp. NKC19-3]|uniref:helix-turn-helix transcriptional regulator n=1 Tax=Virgibacillus saliphilus TaxID=2831674 RepID=UPI001C9ACC58|nr:helix-turn-helix transcriptional regulator [Virgibacillus sp. NKC19-3]MBY7144787.1 helix-turn-helix transcriptional regulator [Virgibacillus sp. NKC19-3]
MKEINLQISNRIRELRARFQWTQQDLASKVGVTRQTIAALEKGDYIPSLLLAMNICHAFQMTVEEVFQFKGGDQQ